MNMKWSATKNVASKFKVGFRNLDDYENAKILYLRPLKMLYVTHQKPVGGVLIIKQNFFV